jgi:GntR family transcriptional regulator/MocR family aminotransferase
MAKQPTTIDIALTPRPEGVTLSRWLYDELRRAVLDGRLPKGARLPSTREFSAQYGVSRRIAVSVFEQLHSEGYILSRTGSGTSVNDTLPEDLLETRAPRPLHHATSESEVPPLFRRPARPFRAIEPALNEFPIDLWSRIASRRMRKLSTALLAGGEIAGHRPLREAIAAYLGSSRGVNCGAEQVVIVSGTQQALDLIARLLIRPSDRVWVEDPCYPGAADAFRNAGARLCPIRVDDEGLDPEIGRSICPRARLAYVTPAHQFPLGSTMSLERRLALLNWARDAGALIIEDDYDSEFRFAGRPVPALQGLDRHDSVIYLGTFNKVLFSSLRIGYMVVPGSLLDPLLALRLNVDRYPAALPQAILCDFLADGHFGRHLRRMRELYSLRLGAFQEDVRRYLAGVLRAPDIQAGLNTPVYLMNELSSKRAEALASQNNIETMALDRFSIQRRDIRGLLVGFAAFDEREIRRGVLALAQALNGSKVKFIRRDAV